MDELLIPSRTIAEGFERFEQVFNLLQKAGLTLKLPKCSSLTQKLSRYLGYEISANGIKPGYQSKIAAVKEFSIPLNIHEVIQLLGLASYYRKFVQVFGEVARPLTTQLHVVGWPSVVSK